MKLIDAEKISNYIKSEINPYGKPFKCNAYKFGLKLIKYLENASVDYDVDKVVEELEIGLEDECLYARDQAIYSEAIRCAIEIVKRG